ncbi:4-hydroxybenzoate 3-monooxygenase [Streptomyces sp. RY43-2]|uniref:4-hydroxybenzoate 3-monooxygenase n=1 Tax=Streptomyces macrolidinus TaxID=2952607 RepID=A0ABT0ZIX0_9ACTN|nr:4-hydroxybenzoate 3-monooxygenase [Streptomyces macrolidinus]MCN9243495.1 4-hydroxybenzoate 3-monooxygenase [Streptomyces macrolidinus]
MTSRVVEDGAAVLIIGAGPAGLVLGNLLLDAGVDCLVVERQSREHVERRARAGFLAANTVRVLTENGLADGLLARGQRHDACAFLTEQGRFELKYGTLGRGEVHHVYPQQDLVTDLVAQFLARGGELWFETEVTEVTGLDGDRPCITARTADGTALRRSGRYVAGCDGRHGVSRRAIPEGTYRYHRRDHGVTWLALLAEAPPSMSAIGYAVHERGFAGHMARTPSVTRYYLQRPKGTDPQGWSDERIWEELNLRMRVDRFGALNEGPILERGVVDMQSDVLDPIRYGSMYLVGDAASLISPAAAKGANLAVMEAEILARALVAALGSHDETLLDRYSADCLPRIWRAQEFSHWMINLLHAPSGDDDEVVFLSGLQLARLETLRTSRAHQDCFAENYVGV